MAQEAKKKSGPAKNPDNQAQNPKNKHFWSFRDAAGENAAPELILYGDIASETWWGDEVTPRQFTEELNALASTADCADAPAVISMADANAVNILRFINVFVKLKARPALRINQRELPTGGNFFINNA